MTYRLIIDDDADSSRRPEATIEEPSWRARMNLPSSPPDTAGLGEWAKARTASEAIALIEERGMPLFVSFDHDLGDGRDAIAVVHWIIERDLDQPFLPADFSFEVHSGNIVGRKNIESLLSSYLSFIRGRTAPGR